MSRFVCDLLRSSAERFPEKIAVIQGSRHHSYFDLSGRADELAERLSGFGVTPGDRVLILLENSAEYIVAYFATMQAGGIAVPVHPQATGRTLERIIDDCSPSVVLDRAPGGSSADIDFGIRVARRGGEGQPLPPGGGSREANGDAVALILYTSGSTGRPKGVMLTHRNLVANAESIVESIRLGSGDRVMVALPFHYSYGNSLLTTHVLTGGSLVLENSFVFPNVVLDRIVREEATGFAGVPSTFAILLSRSNLRKRSFPALRYVTQAGGAMSPKLAADLQEALPGTDVFIMYGLTEASPRLTCLDPSDLLRKAGSVGKAIPGVRITLQAEGGAPAAPGEVGEIVAEGDNVMKGYWNDPEGTAAVLKGGRLFTGDLARADEEGFLTIVGRRSEMIKTGGYRVSPKEMESVLSEMPGVREAAVVGVPDEVLGEGIAAFLEREAGSFLTENDVLRFCSNSFEPFMLPKHVVFLEALPKTAHGKVDRSALKETVFT